MGSQCSEPRKTNLCTNIKVMHKEPLLPSVFTTQAETLLCLAEVWSVTTATSVTLCVMAWSPALDRGYLVLWGVLHYADICRNVNHLVST